MMYRPDPLPAETQQVGCPREESIRRIYAWPDDGQFWSCPAKIAFSGHESSPGFDWFLPCTGILSCRNHTPGRPRGRRNRELFYERGPTRDRELLEMVKCLKVREKVRWSRCR
jgi:hypothetical protein